MKWSWRLGKVAGIGVYVHATFFLMIGWVALSHWTQRHSLAATLAGVGFILAIFACVVLHEFGHALAARRYGIKTRDITLLPIGGVARLERMPEEPIQELWVALAGPAVNVVIAVSLYLWLYATASLEPFSKLSLTDGPFIQRILLLNVSLVLFNMLPAFPMDGGRVLRALLATRIEYTRATHIAANIGQGMALLFGFFGFFTNPFLLFIALFVWIGAGQEASLTQLKSALGGIPIGRAMITDYRTLSPGDSLGRAIELTLAGSQQDFPVEENGRVVGVLTRADLLQALAKGGERLSVSEVMQRDFQMADSSEMLDTIFPRLQNCQCHTLPVTRNGQLVGLMTMDNIGEFILIQSALKASQGKSLKLDPKLVQG
jgi:Zn-dependent protease/predicted transcriptional regulator